MSITYSAPGGHHRKYPYEFYNPWSGFNPCTLAEGLRWAKSILATRWKTNPPSNLGIYNPASKRWVVSWENGKRV